MKKTISVLICVIILLSMSVVNIAAAETAASPVLTSSFGTPTIDGVKDTIYSKSTKIESNSYNTDKYKGTTPGNFTAYFANDEAFLYAYLEVKTNNTAITANELARLYVDFLNTDNNARLADTTGTNTYQATNFPGTPTVYNGGQFEFKASTAAIGALTRGSNLPGIKDKVKFNITTDGANGKWILEAAIPFSDAVAASIKNGEVTIGVGFEVRVDLDGTGANSYYQLRYFDDKGSNWGDYTMCSDVKLSAKTSSTTTATGTTATTAPATGNMGFAVYAVVAAVCVAALSFTRKRVR